MCAGVIPVMIVILCYFSTCARYATDFAVGLGVLSLCGMLGLERWAQSGRRHQTVVTLMVIATAVTVPIGMLLSLDYHARAIQYSAPVRWQALDRSTHTLLANMGHRLGFIDGPRVLKVRFMPQPIGTMETLWRSSDVQLEERILVEHVGEQLIRFGYARGAGAVTWGRRVRWDLEHTHTVSVQVPSLYESDPRGWWANVNTRSAFRERTAVAVWFSGGRALELVVPLISSRVNHGGAVGADFSGEIRKMTSRRFRDDEIEAGDLVAPHLKRGGTLRMRVVLPPRLQEKGEPLFACGAHYQSSIVFVREAEGGVKFVYDNYGGDSIESSLVVPHPAGNVLELELPNFRPDAFGYERKGEVIIRVDGREILRTVQVAYSFAWGDEAIGRNPFGTTCAAAFRGWILDARWSAGGN
jgi:hypothetical protein